MTGQTGNCTRQVFPGLILALPEPAPRRAFHRSQHQEGHSTDVHGLFSLEGRLQRPSLLVVERFVQEKDELHAKSQEMEPATDLMKGIRAQPPAEQRTQMFGAEIHFHRRRGLQRKGQKAHRARAPAGRALFFLGPLGQGRGDAQNQLLLALGTVSLAGDPIPVAPVIVATAAGDDPGPGLTGC
jgi:hypothetical protein